MASGSTHSSVTDSLHLAQPGACRALAERLLASRTLSRSARLRELLAYLTNATFDDPAGLREAAVGCAVYGRPAGYNTNDDNIVRMGVSQLRRKLAEYFEGEGREESLVVEIPRGAYALVFRSAAPTDEPDDADESSAAVPAAALSRGWLFWSAVIAAVLTLGVGLGAAWGVMIGGPDAGQADHAEFWNAVVGDGEPAMFVSEDIEFLAAATAAKRTPSLETYANDRERALEIGGAVGPSPVPATTQLSLQIATRLIASQPAVFSQVRFVASRDVRLDELKRNNVILVGSPRASPWLGLFEGALNFRFEHDPARRVSVFRNRSPLPGEHAEYAATSSEAFGGKVYSLVALAPNLGRTGSVLILMGTRSEGTRAAAEAVTSSPVLDRILDAVGYSGAGRAPYFEALLESSIMGDSTTPPKLVAVRRHEAVEGDSVELAGF